MTGDDLGRLGLSEEQADILESAAAFCEARSPREAVRGLIDGETGYDEAVWDEMCGLGWLGIAVPENHGGLGLDLGAVAPVAEQMGRRLLASPFVSTVLCQQLIVAAGTPAQQSYWLPRLATGTIGAIATMERQGRWDAGDPSCPATRAGGGIALSGTKLLVEDAEAAGVIAVTVRLDGEAAIVLLTPDELDEGSLRRETIIDETRRSCSLRLDGLSVPSDRVLGQDRTAEALHRLALAASLLSAAQCVGGADAVIAFTADYLRERTQFGRPIGSYQGLKHPMADALVRYEQARSHLYAAAHCWGDQGTGEVAVRMAAAAGEAALSFVADRSIQFHGGYGFTYECDAQLYRRAAIWHAARWGDARHHKRALARLLF